MGCFETGVRIISSDKKPWGEPNLKQTQNFVTPGDTYFAFNKAGNIAIPSIFKKSAGTLEFWCNIQSFYNYNSIFGNAVGSNDWETWVGSTGGLEFRMYSSTNVRVGCSLSEFLDRWVHLAFTWWNSTSFSVKLNGETKGSSSTYWPTPGAIYIAGGHGNAYGHLCVSDIRIWDHARTEDQVKECMYWRGINPQDGEGLIAEYQGSSLEDSSGNNHLAVIEGTVGVI